MNYELRIKKSNSGGYTIIETMIAISLFLVIVTIGLGALLNANALHKRSQSTRSIMDNLSFIMEDMSRNIRTGSEYSCGNVGDILGKNTLLNCTGDKNIAFTSSYDGSRWVYQIYLNIIYKSTDGVVTYTNLLPDGIEIDKDSGFTVVGAKSSDTLQPLVTIRLSGTIIDESNGSLIPFSLQTSVSQRLLDRQ